MSHTHHHHSNNNGLSLAFWLNLLFSVLEFIGGILTNSTAIITDAFHDFMDAIAIGSAVLLEKLSGKKRSEKFSYGYKRFSLLAAAGMSIFLLTGAVLMGLSAYQTFINPKTVNSLGMLYLAILGIAVNGFAFLRIKNSNNHAHHHGHAHTTNHNSKAIMLHLLEDVLGWVAVLIGAIVIYFTGWYWVDGILALAIAVFIGYNATKNLMSSMKVLLQSVPEEVNINDLSNELKGIQGIKNIHDLHIWSLDGSYHIGSLHALLDADYLGSENDVFSAILNLMKKYQIQHPTIQIESSTTNCSLLNC